VRQVPVDELTQRAATEVEQVAKAPGGLKGVPSIEVVSEDLEFVSTEKCAWQQDAATSAWRCQPIAGKGCEYCARVKVVKDGKTQIVCQCFD
jgi:hypothetical protein